MKRDGVAGRPQDGDTAGDVVGAIDRRPQGKAGIGGRTYDLVAPCGISAAISSYGARLMSLFAPDRNARLADIVLGFDSRSEYELHSSLYVGCTIGRTANRIRGASFELGGVTYELGANDGPNSLHGGAERSLGKVDWELHEYRTKPQTAVALRYVSPHLEEGYPGRLETIVTYTLTTRSELRIDYEARTDRATPVSLTNHSYWNLTGRGSQSILDHRLQIPAEFYTAVDDNLIPTGIVVPVEGSPLDFRNPLSIGSRISELESTGARGYDHNYVLTSRGVGQSKLAARLLEPESGRILEIFSDRPCIQVYSGNMIEPVTGKRGIQYVKHSGICLEPQDYPDAMHHPKFVSIVLKPHEVYRTTTVYRFSTDAGNQN